MRNCDITIHGKDFAGVIKEKLWRLFWILQGNLNVDTNVLKRQMHEEITPTAVVNEETCNLIKRLRISACCVLGPKWAAISPLP